jgi:signal transduction histidine kinase
MNIESQSPVNLLLVDDQPENLLAVEAVLQPLGANLVRATSGAEALRCLLHQDFAVILLDVQMQDMDGFETAALIRKRARSQQTPIIFLTALNSNHSRFQGYASGAVDYLLKPFEPQVLLSKVAIFIELFKKTEALRTQTEQLMRLNQELRAERDLAESAQIRMLQEQLARQQAELNNKLTDQFLGVLSHELRTPLNAVLGWSRLLRAKRFDSATMERALETIERNALLQNQMIGDILDISKIIQGRLELHYGLVSLKGIVESAIAAIQPEADAKFITITLQEGAETGKLWGDPKRIQQSILNLLSNAVKFTPQGGQIEVKWRCCRNQSFGLNTEVLELPSTLIPDLETCLEIQVIDSGVGIAPDFLPNVFDRFRQADSSSTRPFGGIGLGLAIVQHLVELNGGCVEAMSEGEGKGAIFTIRLPVCQESHADPNKKSAYLPSSRIGSNH